MLVQIDLPHDTKQIVQEYQHEMKIKKGLGHYNQGQAIIAIIREHGAMKEELANLKRLLTEKEKESNP